MRELRFNYLDLFKIPRLAFSPQRIWTNGLGLLASYFAYLFFTYLSLLLSGLSFTGTWYAQGLLPCIYAYPDIPWYGHLLYYLGITISLYIILITNTAVARLHYMNIRDELFYSWRQAIKFALRKWTSIIGAIIAFAVIIGFFVVGAIVLGFVAKIPWLGELGTAIFTIPFILAALFLIFAVVVSIIAILIIPAILATQDEDALGATFQTFNLVYNQPLRIIFYLATIGILELLGILLFGLALKGAFVVFTGLFEVGMGSKLLLLKKQALYYLENWLPILKTSGKYLPEYISNWFYCSQQAALPHSAGNAAMSISGWIMAVSLLFTGGIALAYGEAIGNGGLTLLVIILNKIQNDENLLEREDEEIESETEDIEENQTAEKNDTPEDENTTAEEESSQGENKE
ncbi:MAG: hypothetical protein Kow0037_17930 [Calditrichia bacterium]